MFWKATLPCCVVGTIDCPESKTRAGKRPLRRDNSDLIIKARSLSPLGSRVSRLASERERERERHTANGRLGTRRGRRLRKGRSREDAADVDLPTIVDRDSRFFSSKLEYLHGRFIIEGPYRVSPIWEPVSRVVSGKERRAEVAKALEELSLEPFPRFAKTHHSVVLNSSLMGIPNTAVGDAGADVARAHFEVRPDPPALWGATCVFQFSQLRDVSGLRYLDHDREFRRIAHVGIFPHTTLELIVQ